MSYETIRIHRDYPIINNKVQVNGVELNEVEALASYDDSEIIELFNYGSKQELLRLKAIIPGNPGPSTWDISIADYIGTNQRFSQLTQTGPIIHYISISDYIANTDSLIATAINPIISQFAPDAFYTASQKWYADGAIQIGWTPQSGYLANYLKSTSTVFQSSSSGWLICCTFKIDRQVSNAVQCLVSKFGVNKREYSLRYDPATTLLSLTVATANNSSSQTVTSTVAVPIGSVGKVVCGFNSVAGNIFISAQTGSTTELRQTQSIGFTIGADTGEFQIGNEVVNSYRFWGVIDSLGWCKDYNCTDDDIAELNAGTVYRNLSVGLKAKFDVSNKGAWYDFGTPTPATDAASRLTWSWLDSSAATALPLTQATISGKYPWMTVGLNNPQQTSDTDATNKASILLDQSGNNNHIVQPYDLCRWDWQSTGGIGSTPCFYSSGNHITHAYDPTVEGHGQFLPCWTQGPSLTGTNVSWWWAMIFYVENVYAPASDNIPTDAVYGQYLAGQSNIGFVPWSLYSYVDNGIDNKNKIGFGLSVEGNSAQALPLRFRLLSERKIDGYSNYSGDAYKGRLSAGQWHVAVGQYDGSTKTTTLRINKTLIFSKVQEFDNSDNGSHSLGTQTITAWTWLDALSLDQFAFPPGAGGQAYDEFGGALNSLYGKFDLMCNKVGSTLTANQQDALADLLLPTLPSTTPQMSIPAVETNLIFWLDATYFEVVSTSGFTAPPVLNNAPLPVVVSAENDPIGWFDSRIGTRSVTYGYAVADGNRPLLHLNGQGPNRVWRFTRTNNHYLHLTVPTLVQPYSITIAFRWHTTPAQNQSVIYGETGDGVAFGVSSGQLYIYSGSSILFTMTAPTVFAVYTLVFNGANSKVFKDGVQVASGNAGSMSNTSGLQIGRYPGGGGTEYANIDLSQLLIHTGALALADNIALNTQIRAALA